MLRSAEGDFGKSLKPALESDRRLELGRGGVGNHLIPDTQCHLFGAGLQCISPNFFIQNEQFLTRFGPVLPSIRFDHEITTTSGLHGAPGLDRLNPSGAAWVRPQCHNTWISGTSARRCAAGGCRVDQAARQCSHNAFGSAAHGAAGCRSEPGVCIGFCRRTLTRHPGLRVQRPFNKPILALSPEAPHSSPTTA